MDELLVSRKRLVFDEFLFFILSVQLLKEKTEEAKRLLLYSDKPLTAISSYLGFSSPSHFSRVFRKYVSLNPGEYRQKYAR